MLQLMKVGDWTTYSYALVRQDRERHVFQYGIELFVNEVGGHLGQWPRAIARA